jgi:hypothetical protein
VPDRLNLRRNGNSGTERKLNHYGGIQVGLNSDRPHPPEAIITEEQLQENLDAILQEVEAGSPVEILRDDRAIAQSPTSTKLDGIAVKTRLI